MLPARPPAGTLSGAVGGRMPAPFDGPRARRRSVAAERHAVARAPRHETIRDGRVAPGAPPARASAPAAGVAPAGGRRPRVTGGMA